jgi:signal transduction histidine kinase/ActR/RegA family two-component response regulator
MSLSHLRSIALSTFLLATLVALIIRDRVPVDRLYCWLTATYVLVVIRVLIATQYARKQRSDAELRRWLVLLAVALSCSASVWGALIFVSEDPSDGLVTTTAILFTGGLLAGGAQSLMGTPKVLLAVAFFNVAPILIMLLGSGSPEHRYIATTIVVYLVMVTQFARRNRQLLRESIALRFGNLDLVERRTEEKARAEAARDVAERAIAAKDQFLAAASHDIRQPVHAAFLFLGALENEHRASSALLDKLRASLVAARQMLDALLDVSRLDAGVVERADQSLRAESLATSLSTLFVPVAERKDITLSLRASPGVWLRSDPNLCQRILANLVNNAIKYTHTGGVLVAFRRRPDHCLVQVWDTGIGIPLSELPVIFDEFTQLNNPERDGSRGIGLGLAIVRRLCLLLGTSIEVKSRVGRGSVFSFRLPLGEPTQVPGLMPAVEGAGGSARLLVVDDNALVRDGLAALLTSWGYQTLLAEDVEHARSVAEREKDIDLAIVDYRLPSNKTALDAIAAIRATIGREVPAVIITGDTHPQRIREASSAGHPVMFKPVPPDALRAALRRLLDERPLGDDG